MAEVLLEKVPQKVRDLFNKGFSAFERGNLDYAIDMMTACLELEPYLLQARKFLRAAEIKRFRQGKSNSLTHIIITAKSLPMLMNAFALLKKGDAMKAVNVAEHLLKLDPFNHTFMKLFIEAAGAADMPEASIQMLEMVRELQPHDKVVLNLLGTLYTTTGRTRDSRRCFEELVALSPNDPKALKMLKDALAIDSMTSDGWQRSADKGGSFRDMIKNEKEAVLLEQQSKAVKSDQDVDALIIEMEGKIEKEPNNVNYFRSLARLYTQKKDFPKAVERLKTALEKNPGDPELDASLSQTRIQQFNHDIAALREAGNEEGAVAKEQERDQFAFDDLQERVKRYPNDLRLRYDLGVMLYENDYFTEAVQQFQLSQRSPKQRVLSLYYMALCFKKKNQLDLALDQLKKADSEIPIMDASKKDVMYEIGAIAEAMGDRKTAGEYFKRIYQADIGYRDIAEKIEKFYQKQP